MCQENGIHCWGREETGKARSIQQGGKVNKVRRKQGILANCKYLIYQVQHHQSGTLPQTFLPVAQCHMAQNTCLLLPHCHMPALPWHLKKPQLHLCNSCEPLLSANMLILLEMLVIFESNWSWQGRTDTLLLFCQQLALQGLVQTSRVELGKRLMDKHTGAVIVSSDAISACTKPAPRAALWPLLPNCLKFYTVITENIVFQMVIWVTRGSWFLL